MKRRYSSPSGEKSGLARIAHQVATHYQDSMEGQTGLHYTPTTHCSTFRPIAVQTCLGIRMRALHLSQSYGYDFRPTAAGPNTTVLRLTSRPGERCGLACGLDELSGIDLLQSVAVVVDGANLPSPLRGESQLVADAADVRVRGAGVEI